jgi:hypothetical protein
VQARPIYHRTRDSIEAHLTIVFTADPRPEELRKAIEEIDHATPSAHLN